MRLAPVRDRIILAYNLLQFISFLSRTFLVSDEVLLFSISGHTSNYWPSHGPEDELAQVEPTEHAQGSAAYE